MGMCGPKKFLCSVLLIATYFAYSTHAVDLMYSEITPVNDDTRYVATHPEAKLTPLNKLHHVKGNIVFSSGERITGDRLLLTHYDNAQFTKSEDIEAVMRYPAVGRASTITRIEIYVDLSSDDADAYFTQGGIDQTFAEVLLTCDRTRTFTYELFLYGY